MAAPIHMSAAVSSLDKARAFYGETLGLEEGRSGSKRIDYNFYGHHLVLHLCPEEAAYELRLIEGSDDPSPIRHFGVFLELPEWKKLADRMKQRGIHFRHDPELYFAGDAKEQYIMMVDDGCGNAVEFKSQRPELVFAKSRPAVAADAR